MVQFLISFISIIAGLLAIISALGLTVSNDLENILSITGIPLSVIFGVSCLIAFLSSGSAYYHRSTVTKKQIQLGGKNNTQKMG
jgi:hypothetical protein